MAAHDHNPILDLYGTPRATIGSRVSELPKPEQAIRQRPTIRS